jgi:hypothetical protein
MHHRTSTELWQITTARRISLYSRYAFNVSKGYHESKPNREIRSVQVVQGLIVNFGDLFRIAPCSVSHGFYIKAELAVAAWLSPGIRALHDPTLHTMCITHLRNLASRCHSLCDFSNFAYAHITGLSMASELCSHKYTGELDVGICCLTCSTVRRYPPETDPSQSSLPFISKDEEYQYEPVDTTSNTIRLIVLSPGNDSDPTSCRVISTNSNLALPFIAISYTWTSEDETRPMHRA